MHEKVKSERFHSSINAGLTTILTSLSCRLIVRVRVWFTSMASKISLTELPVFPLIRVIISPGLRPSLNSTNN